MTVAIPTTEPGCINAGDTVKWLKTLTDYPATDGWVLKYTYINATAKQEVTAAAQGADYAVTILAATSAAWAAGSYDWRATVAKAGEVYTVAGGRSVVKPSFGVATLDARSQARRALEAVETMMEGRASSATAEYEIAGRKLKYIPVPELLQLRDKLRADVAREDAASDIAAGLAPRGRIHVRFGP